MASSLTKVKGVECVAGIVEITTYTSNPRTHHIILRLIEIDPLV